MNKDKYNYVMRYVPMRKDITDITAILPAESGGVQPPEIDAVAKACLSAVEAMSAMTAMVFMKCMDADRP